MTCFIVRPEMGHQILLILHIFDFLQLLTRENFLLFKGLCDLISLPRKSPYLKVKCANNDMAYSHGKIHQNYNPRDDAGCIHQEVGNLGEHLRVLLTISCLSTLRKFTIHVNVCQIFDTSL